MERARALYQEVINTAEVSDAALAAGCLATLLAMQGEKSDALRHIKFSLIHHPKIADFWATKGALEAEAQNLEQAYQDLSLALRLGGTSQENILRNRAQVSKRTGNYTAAKADLVAVSELAPNYPSSWVDLGECCGLLGDLDGASSALQRAINLRGPESSFNEYLTLAEIQFSSRDYKAAADSFSKALSIKRDSHKTLARLAESLRRLGRSGEALNLIGEKWRGDNHLPPELALVLASIKRDQGDFDGAHESLNLISEESQYYRQACFISGTLALSKMRFNDGWALLEKSEDPSTLNESKIPRWDGNRAINSLLILGEQGLGDQLLFFTAISKIQELVRIITVTCDSRLIPILDKKYPTVSFISRSKTHFAHHDAYIRARELGRYATSGNTNAEPSKSNRNEWSTTLLERLSGSNRRIRCGIGWKSIGAGYSNLKSFKPNDFLDVENIKHWDLFSLQYDGEDELNELDPEKRHRIQPVALDIKDDLLGLYEFIQSLDLVITASNSLAHLAGFAGKRTFVVVPEHAGKFWYWYNMQNGRHLWYPSLSVIDCIAGKWSEAIKIAARDYLTKKE
jgi:Flp pilus assembly protein TadD